MLFAGTRVSKIIATNEPSLNYLSTNQNIVFVTNKGQMPHWHAEQDSKRVNANPTLVQHAATPAATKVASRGAAAAHETLESRMDDKNSSRTAP